MHTFVCIVGLSYRLIVVCAHDIICVYVCLYKCTNKINVLSTNSIPTWGQKILWLRNRIKMHHFALITLGGKTVHCVTCET